MKKEERRKEKEKENYYNELIKKEKEKLKNKNKNLETTNNNTNNTNIEEYNSEIIQQFNKNKLALNEHANKLINKLKINKYKEIFNKLDGDNDGLISYDNLKVIDIDNEELIQISSLIDEIKTKKLTTLSFIDFKKLAEQFYNQ
jgi:hypothetical protein